MCCFVSSYLKGSAFLSPPSFLLFGFAKRFIISINHCWTSSMLFLHQLKTFVYYSFPFSLLMRSITLLMFLMLNCPFISGINTIRTWCNIFKTAPMPLFFGKAFLLYFLLPDPHPVCSQRPWLHHCSESNSSLVLLIAVLLLNTPLNREIYLI